MAAITALTSVTKQVKTVFGNKRIAIGYFTLGNGSDTIPHDGLSLSTAALGLREVELILFDNKSCVWSYDYTNHMVIAAGSGVSDGLKFNYNVAGDGTIVPASGETVKFIAIGYGTR